MHLLPWLYMSVNLGLLPGLALAPGKSPELNMKTAETALYMQMWGNFSNEQTADEEMEETAPGAGTGGGLDKNTSEENATAVEVFNADDQNSTLAAKNKSHESPGTEAVNEQTAEVEVASESTEGTAVADTIIQDTEAIQQTPSKTVVESVGASVEVTTPLYAVNGAVLDPGIQEYLYTRLAESGIPWFMPYAVLIAYGESRFDIYAVNQTNHEDMGLFQFKSRYWGAGDIFNPYTQIDVFVGLMANRANIGCTVSDMISRHNVSDYGSYNQEYVDYIMSEAGNLLQIR